MTVLPQNEEGNNGKKKLNSKDKKKNAAPQEWKKKKRKMLDTRSQNEEEKIRTKRIEKAWKEKKERKKGICSLYKFCLLCRFYVERFVPDIIYLIS